MAMNLKEYAQSLGIKMPSATAKAVDVEAGKAGYEKYLADVEAANAAKNNAIEAEKSKQTWWDKAASIILQANGMSSAMTNDPISTGFNQAVAAYKSIPDDYNSKPTDEWTDDERWAFGEKYTSNANEAYAMAKDLNTRKANEKKQKQQESIANWSGKNLGTGILGSAASLGLNTIYGSVGYLDALAQRAAGREVEQNVILPHEIAGAMQSGVATKLNEKGGTLNENIPIIGGKGWGDLYGLGMSLAQSRIGVASGSQAYTLASFFGMAASQGVTDALARGATGDQAIAYGTIAGLAEAIPEMISVDKLIGMESKEGVQNLFKNMLKQAGEEAGEEFTTSLINNIADDWIMGGKSQFYQTVNQLVASGMSIEEAKKKAWIQTIEDIAFDTISGAASGAISGGISTGKNRFNQQFLQTEKNEAAKKLLTPEQNKLIEDAKQYDTTKKRASALEKKLADGKELSGYELRMLASQVNEASRAKDVDTVRKAIVDKMKAEGVNKSQAKVLGEIALNKAIGNDISKVQDLMLKRNAAANKVYNQISAEVMESGIGDSDWAAKTPIARLRAEKKAAEQTAEPKTESKPMTGLDQLKADIAAKYGADTREYKINVESLEGKIEIKDGGYAYKKSSENSRIHTEGISSALTTDDIVELSAIEKIANELGIDIYVYETQVDKNGQRTYTDKTGKKLSDSGFYDPNDNSIHIDLRAGQNGEGTMLYTASHEVVHFIKENASEHYAALEELVTKELVKGGFSMEKAIEVQRKKATENGQTLTDEQLREEVIAEACQSFLASKNAVAEIKALKSENKGLWTALKKFFTSLFTKLNNIYKTVPPDSIEGKYIANMRKAVKPIRDAFLEGAVEAGKKANAKTTATQKTAAKKVKSQARITSEQDAAYLDAVKRGDMETAQKMVDEAAKAAGYTERVFHGTRSGEFYVFDENRIGDNYGGYNAEGGAFDFTYDISRAWLWAGKAQGTGKPRVIEVFIKAEKPFYSYDGAVAKELFDLLPEELSEDEKKYAMSYGIPFKEVLEQHGIDFKTAITSKGIDSYMMYRGDFGNIGVYSPFQIKSADAVTYDDNGNVIPLSERFNEKSKDIRYKARSISKITAEMTDAERYEILKDKKITAPYYNGEVDSLIAEELEGKINNAAKKAVVKIAEKLGIPGTEINIKDIDVDIKISRSNLKESISKDATPEQIAKLLPILVPAVEESILIERHNNRYYFDTDTVYFDNLLGGYVEKELFIPVRFGLKHGINGNTTLYVVVDQNKIAIGNIGQKNSDRGHQDVSPTNEESNNLRLPVTYSISDIFPFVKSKDLLRYIPDQMLDDEQRKAKWEAIAETIRKSDDKNDAKYSEYIANGNETAAAQMVRNAAKTNGYIDKVYHGTKAFGFTEFDTEKSDDKRSLFAAGSTELAQTYSGKHGTKKLSDNKNIDGLSNKEVVKMLNAEATQSYEGAEMQTEYDIMTLNDVNNLINEVYDGIDDLQKVLEGKIKEYADKMARDFDDKDATTHRRLIEAFNLLNAFEYKRLSTPLYVLLHHTDAFEDSPKQIAELEYKIRLMNKLTDTDTSNGVVVKKDLGGYGVSVLSFVKAREELKGLVSSGNYALYGKPGRQLVIDAKGQNWNNIKNWIQSAYRSTKDTYVKKDDMYYRLYDSNTNEQIFHGRIEITDKNKDMSIDSIHPIMVQKANNVLAIRSEYMKTTRDIAKFAKDEGYDSIKFENLVDNGGAGESVEAGDVYVYFNPSDLKSADTITYDENDKIIPISQRFDATKKDIRHKSRTYSPGQVAKMKADLSHQKVYSKSTAMKFVKAVAPGIKTKAFDELSKDLWIGLNTYTSLDDKQAFAKDMADMIVDRMLVDTEVKNSKWDEAVEKIAYLKPAINTIKFREEDLPNLEHMLDKNGLRSLRARWGYKSKEGEHKRAYGLDEFVTDLSREMPGMAYLADMHPTEAMVEVDNLYRKLKDTINQRYESAYEDATEEQIERWKSTIEAKILDVYEYYGNMSKMLQATSSTSEAVDAYLSTVPEGTENPEKYFVDLLKQMDERISFWKAEKSKTEQISKWNGFIGNKAAEIRDYKNGAFLNATQYHPDIFKNSIEQLTAVTWRGNISPKGVRKVFAELKKWYTMENPMLYNKDNDDNLYSDQIAFYIDLLAADADVEKPLAADEYPMIYDVMNHLYTMMKNYGKIFRAGRWVDAAEIAKAYIGIIDKNDKKRTAWTRAQSLYNRQFLEPMALARQADNYNPDGFFTQTVEELRRAGINASIGEMRLRKEYDAFVDANQKYLMNAAKETVKYRGYDIPKLHLISLYMSMKRKQSREGLALNGFEYTMKTAWWDSEDVIKVPGYLPQSEKYNTDLINRATEEQMRIIAENFTDTDRQYISILEKLFNEELRKLKIERDMERQGYTNALEGYYYPIIRGGIAKNIDTAKFTDINRATNSSFNKSTQKHAQQYLKIISADAMVNRHIKDMCKYYYMSQAIENYNVLYQIDTTEGEPNLNNPRNIAERLKVSKVWEKDFDYFKKLVSDIQGIRENQYDSDGWRLVESLRGNYAKFALGLNAKVLFTQASSIIAAGDVIGFGSLMSLKKNAGLIATKEDIEKYCPIAAVRSYEQTALKAMTLSDKMGKVSEKLMVGISVMDDLVVRRLFSACQVEAKKRGAGEIGTEDNKIVAGKILEQIILETQQNSYATEKSSAMRSANPLWRGLTMFTADGMKIISRIHDAVGELKVAKNNGNTAEIKAARKHLARSIAVATAISVYMTAIASLFNWIYGRKKKDEEEKPLMKVHNFTTELIGNFIGALPIVSELYDRIVNGFEVEDVVYDTINNLYGSISNLYKDATDMVDGKRDRTVEDLNRDLRSLLYAVGQVTGMPVRNVYNLARGMIGIASPKAGYYIDSKFENTSLVTDLKKAVKEGNNSKTAYIMGLIYDERLDDRVSEAQSKEILRLYKRINDKEIEGYTVIPKDIPDEIKRDGVTIELTDSKKEKIVSEYSKVISAIDKLVSSSFYLAQTDDGRAYLIDYYHEKYYETAVNNALEIKEDKVAVYNAVGFSTYAKFAYVTRGIQSDKDRYGNTIPGSKKKKVTEAIEKASKDENKKLLYLASLGYSLTEEQKKKLCKYLNSLSVSASNKKSLAEMCNLTYKNGKIYP